MSEPEIARRCLSCGASVRGRASFCPQCGSRMGEATDESRSDAATAGTTNEPRPPVRSPLVEEAARVAATLNEKLPPRSPETSASGSHRVAPE
ncbi:MAG TPA: zinc-ribbon domain-containing protein, partial [Pyrinomonadaceae bacterium]|nr:zinc-ribbon domain-containing protein [Pyrinomonadaceae bacterium]